MLNSSDSLLSNFQYWLDTAKGGEVFTYCIAGTLGDKHLTSETLATAEHAKRAYARGLVELCQKRRVDASGNRDGFDYLAVKKGQVRVPQANGVLWVPKIIGPGKPR
jgi:ribosomal protein S12 methylthiotransferase accessory factor YcaO